MNKSVTRDRSFPSNKKSGNVFMCFYNKFCLMNKTNN